MAAEDHGSGEVNKRARELSFALAPFRDSIMIALPLFLRGGSVIKLSASDLAEMADDIAILANTEGLTAHRRSVEVRLNRDSGAL